jgi:hypothetical protein
VGFHAQQVRQGICQRGATQRQDERTPGPIGPDTLAKHRVQWHVREREAVCNGAIRALAKAGVLGAKVSGMAAGTELETTERYTGGGQVTRKVRIEATRGQVQELEVTVSGWNVRRVMESATKSPLAVTLGKIQAQETHWTRALVTQARAHLAGCARLQQRSFAKGFVAGTDRWWLDQHALTLVVPAKATMAVTADARAPAAAAEETTVGRRVQTVRHGQGRTAWTARLERAVVGIPGLTTDDQYGTPEQGRHANRRDFQANPLNAVVVRTWPGKDDGPGGTPVLLTTASVAKPLPPFEDDDERRLMEHCGSTEAKPPWDLGHPPQKTARAVRGPVLFPLLLFALATAYRLPCECKALGGEPVGWQRWRRQLLEQTREKVSGLAQGHYGLWPRAEYSLVLGVKLQDVPPAIGGRQQVVATYGLPAQG